MYRAYQMGYFDLLQTNGLWSMGISPVVSSVRLSWPMKKIKQTYDFISVSIQKHDRVYIVRGMIVERNLAYETQHAYEDHTDR